VTARGRFLLWGPVALLVAYQFWLSSQSTLPSPGFAFPHLDKLEHAGYFFFVGLLALRAGRFGEGWSPRTSFLSVVLGGLLLGVLDEFHQSFVPERGVEALDVAADTAGALVAALAGEALLRATGLDRVRR
jgi:VanZ family protein